MDPRAVTTLKLALFAFVALVLGGFILKHIKLQKKIDKLTAEMRVLVSDTSFYRSPTVESAHSTLFKGIAMIEDAKKLGLDPINYFDTVFGHDQKGHKVGLDDEFSEFPAREKLARETLLRAYQQAEHFKFLDSPDYIESLRAGEMPPVVPKPTVACIIDPSLSPGMEKIVANLELRSAARTPGPPNDLEVAAAKNLSSDLYSSHVIESDADSRIARHYDKREPLKTEPKPEPKEDPVKEPATAEP